MRLVRSLIFAAALAGALPTLLAAQQPPRPTPVRKPPATMSGQVVVDSVGTPISNAIVEVVGGVQRAVTDENGKFALTDLPAGYHLIRVRALGYQQEFIEIEAEDGVDFEGRIGLKLEAQRLEDIDVNVIGKPEEYNYTRKYDDFFRRRNTGAGYYWYGKEIADRNFVRSMDIMLGLPGIHVRNQGNRRLLVFSDCPAPGVWIDGVRVRGEASEVIEMIHPDQLEAMEVYNRVTRIPPEARTDVCAAVFLWTKTGGPKRR